MEKSLAATLQGIKNPQYGPIPSEKWMPEQEDIAHAALNLKKKDRKKWFDCSSVMLYKVKNGSRNFRYNMAKEVWEGTQRYNAAKHRGWESDSLESLAIRKGRDDVTKQVKTVSANSLLGDVKEEIIKLWREEISQCPVTKGDTRKVIGGLSFNLIQDVGDDVRVGDIMEPKWPVFSNSTPLFIVRKALVYYPAVLTEDKEGDVTGILTNYDLTNHILGHRPRE